MALEVDVKAVFLYSPEIFLSALPLDLIEGENRWADYSGFAPLIVTLYGFSFARYDGVTVGVSADGVTDVVRLEDLGAAKGLNFEEEVKVSAARNMSLRVIAPATISAYQLRHKVKVNEPNILLKMLLGLPLTRREEALAEKYELTEKLILQRPKPYNPYEGIDRVYSITRRMAESGTILWLPVPNGMKAVLLNIAAYRPPSAGQAYITVKRDDRDALRVDPYCLQGLEWPIGLWPKYPIRIVALDHLRVELDWTSGTHRIRLVYGLGKITIPEKIRWGIELTDKEAEIAEKLNLHERIEVGLT